VVFDGCRQQEHRCSKLSGRGKSVFQQIFGLQPLYATADEAVCRHISGKNMKNA